MSETYNRWKDDPSVLTTLTALGLASLDEEQQSLLERAVGLEERGRKSSLSNSVLYWARKDLVKSGLVKTMRGAASITETVANVLESQSFAGVGAKDPHVELGDTHPKGIGDITPTDQ